MSAKIGIVIQSDIGIGDKIQFSSLPENFYRSKNQKLIDVSKSWIFDYNPYVFRDKEPTKVFDLWKIIHDPTKRPESIGDVFLSNAERTAAMLGVSEDMHLNRPRLYKFEEKIKYQNREAILFQLSGKSHGKLPDHIIEHVIQKYGSQLIQIGDPNDIGIGVQRLITPGIWDLVKVISGARMLIGPDSGLMWIEACYPDIILKKVRMKPMPDKLKKWVPLSGKNLHSQWDSREFMIYNPTEDDLGATWSYKRI